MLRPFTNISINNEQLRSIASNVVIESRRNEFTDTARIVMPNNITGKGEKVSDLFKLGDPVIIDMGYYPNSSTRFTGYISEIVPDRTATIICEDEAYVYKRKTIEKAVLLKNTTTTALFNQIFEGEKIVFDAKIGDWKIGKDASLFDVLNKLLKDFSIFSYFRDSVLIVGGGLNDELGNEVIITADFQGNVPQSESSIDFTNATSEQTIVKGSSQKRDGTKIIVYGYYGSGNTIITSTTKPNGAINGEIKLGENDEIDEATLTEAVIRKLEAISFTGVNGSLTIYGEPQVLHGDIVNIIDRTRPEINGQYKCVGVITSFGVDTGFRQELELGIKVS